MTILVPKTTDLTYLNLFYPKRAVRPHFHAIRQVWPDLLAYTGPKIVERLSQQANKISMLLRPAQAVYNFVGGYLYWGSSIALHDIILLCLSSSVRQAVRIYFRVLTFLQRQPCKFLSLSHLRICTVANCFPFRQSFRRHSLAILMFLIYCACNF